LSQAVESALRAVVDVAKTSFGVELSAGSVSQLTRFTEELLKWNARINLTAITEPGQVAELHILDSLAIAPHLGPGARLLDVGTGGGFPGVPIAIARPDVRVTLVDRTEKKILFLKTTLARLGISNAIAIHHRAEEGAPAEVLGSHDVVVSRALTAPETWFPLARTFAAEGGRVIAMLGSQQPSLGELESLRSKPGEEVRLLRYGLPGGAERALAILELAGESSSSPDR